MPDYEKMYHIMFNAATDAERLLGGDTQASMILRKAQQDCEELYIEAENMPRQLEAAHMPRQLEAAHMPRQLEAAHMPRS